MTGKKPCIRCLLSQMPDAGEEEQLVRRMIEALRDEDRCEEDEYERRLAICQECSFLQNGTCQQCGCYVEYRAAVAVRSCACFPPKWKACA